MLEDILYEEAESGSGIGDDEDFLKENIHITNPNLKSI